MLILAGSFSVATDASAQISLQSVVGPQRGGIAEARISSDGTTATAWGLDPDGTLNSYLWTAADGLRRFDELGEDAPSGNRFTPQGISGDGSRIVGSAGNAPVLWERGVGTTSLATHPTGPGTGIALGISDDGEYIVGLVHSDQIAITAPLGSSVPQPVPARWSVDTNQLDVLSDVDGRAHAVSNNGVAVGQLTVPAPSIFLQPFNIAFRDAPGTDPQYIPPAPNLGGVQWARNAVGISADGSTIAGESPGTLDDVSFPYPPLGILWSGDPGTGDTLPAEGITTIVPPRPFGLGVPQVDVQAMSADGSAVVGTFSDGVSFIRPFLWTRERGMEDLQTLLAASGVDLGDWTIDSATGVSADGKTIVGLGRLPMEGNHSILGRAVWLVTIPEPNTAMLLALGLAGLSARRQPK